MRYELVTVSGTARRIFKEGTAYDDREIVRLADKSGMKAERPNGSSRIRGSSRINVNDSGRIVARFERKNYDNGSERATVVAHITGRA